MKTRSASAALGILLLGLSLDAAEPKNSDARSDGLFGSVRSVSTSEERAQIEWHQPNGPTVALPVKCWECEYDADGNRIKSGQIIDGVWQGEITRFLRDSQGNLIERIAENAKGEMNRREAIGPYGISEQVGFENGKQISRSLWFYDANGHLSGSRNYDRGMGSLSKAALW